MSIQPDDVSAASWVVAAGRDDAPGAPLNVPIVPASTYVLGGERGYSRDEGTPTWEALETLVGGLEGGRAVAFASGMAAAAAVFDQLPVGARVALPTDCYQGVAGLAARGAELGRWTVSRIDVDDPDGWVAAAGSSDLVWVESPSNPLLVVADLPRICSAVRRPGALVAVDSTFATPLGQRPLSFGADVVVHSATKHLGGHSDLLGGLAVTRHEDLYDGLRTCRTLHGATPGALEAYLAVRGARTLALRLGATQASAGELARRLDAHADVSVVRYPGMPGHPTHDVAVRVLDGFGSVISFDVTGDAARADRLGRATRLVRHATSLGGVESTMERRAAVPGQEHLPPTLLRLSVGCEDVEDLWRDLEDALQLSR